jgi:hypothetical protein
VRGGWIDEQEMREMEEAKLEVILADGFQTEARYELTYGGAEFIARSYEDDPAEAYREVIGKIRHGLALAYQVGHMDIVFDVVDTDAAKRAIASFEPAELAITLADVARAHQKEIEGHTRAVEFAEGMIELIESQKAHEGENLTTGEAIERAIEGEKQMRKIVGDEEK